MLGIDYETIPSNLDESTIRDVDPRGLALTDRGNSLKIDVHIVPAEEGFRIVFDVWENHAVSKEKVGEGIKHAKHRLKHKFEFK